MGNMLPCRSIMTRYLLGIPLFLGFIFFSVIFFTVAGVHAQTTDEQAITRLLTAQAAAWNQGDIGAFMDSYEKSGDTAYVGAEPVKGYNAILARYRSRYPDRATMGHLSFSDLDVHCRTERRDCRWPLRAGESPRGRRSRFGYFHPGGAKVSDSVENHP